MVDKDKRTESVSDLVNKLPNRLRSIIAEELIRDNGDAANSSVFASGGRDRNRDRLKALMRSAVEGTPEEESYNQNRDLLNTIVDATFKPRKEKELKIATKRIKKVKEEMDTLGNILKPY